MPNFWLKVKVWTKIVVLVFVLLYLLVFVAKNSGRPVEFWYWYNGVWPTSLLYFTFATFLAGVVVTILARTIYKTISQYRELRDRTAQERRDREFKELQAKAALLQPRTPAPPPPSSDPPADASPSA